MTRTPDDSFVRRIAEAYAPPPRGPAQRAAFAARLGQRLHAAERRRGRRVLAVGALAASAAVAVLVLRLSPSGPAVGAHAPQTALPAVSETGADQAEAIFALAIDSEPDTDDALPDDYEAIAGVFLGG